MAKRGFRLSIDDNIRFLENLNAHPEYTSLFDDPYLRMHRDIHEKYGNKVHFNLFYYSEDGSFNLSMMTDRFKDEWAANADWIRLSFHSKAEFPSWPYLNASYDEVYEDHAAVKREILRFAGPEVFGPVTTVHFAEATRDGVRALRDQGIRFLLGDFSFKENGERWLDYYLDAEQFDLVRKNCFYKDPETDMIFCCCDIVLDCFRPEAIGPELARIDALYPDRCFMDILIHEQYFYEDYINYRPFYRELVETGVKWCLDKGYEPVFVAEMVDPDAFEA